MIDPIAFQQEFWPDVHFYDKQREIIYSVLENDETVSPASNKAGKDYVAGFLCLYCFVSRNPCRGITTSVKDDHLRVLWGEINHFISTSKHPLKTKDGGILLVNHHEIKKVFNGKEDPKSYLRGMVAGDGAAMQGHHLPHGPNGEPSTFFFVDEASGVPDEYYTMAATWAHRMLIFGNPWPCSNFFYRAVKGWPGTEDRGGSLLRNPADDSRGYYRKIIQIAGVDSPNVRYALEEIRRGRDPSNRIITPGVLTWQEYQKRRALWDKIRQCVSLDGQFYEGAETLMFPPDWLDRAEQIAQEQAKWRKGVSIGCDPAEGGDSSCWSVCDYEGLIELVSMKTPDTSVIPTVTIELMRKYRVLPENVWFDRGGGGKEHADVLRKRGYAVKSLSFGESASDADRWNRFKLRNTEFRRDESEDKTTYANRRAEMYGILRQFLKPYEAGFGIPGEFGELRRQLAPIPLRYNREQVMYMLPKHRNTPTSKEENLYDLLGCSPDEADSLVLACYGLMEAQQERPQVGVYTV